MLTEEQIKNLKPGQELCCKCSFVETQDYGNRIVVDMCYAGSKERTTSRIGYFYEQLSLPPTPPKHAPTRLFKKGDKVRVVEWHGRAPFPLNDINDVDLPESWQSEIYTVTEGERLDDCNCVLSHANTQFSIILMHPAHLQLVTPVEELEPYSIDPANSNVLFKDGKKFATFEDDDETQELCDRLNAEWRKEQNND